MLIILFYYYPYEPQNRRKIISWWKIKATLLQISEEKKIYFNLYSVRWFHGIGALMRAENPEIVTTLIHASIVIFYFYSYPYNPHKCL